MSGTLYVVATPIGNLEDITLRAVRILGEVDAIAAEDTRITRRLLDRYEIGTPLISFHRHSNEAKLSALVARLRHGEDLALVTDSGTPSVSDPGGELVSAVCAAGISVVPIPGPSAVAVALSVAGMRAQRFHFLGFPPRKPGDRRRFFAPFVEDEETLVLYESPFRVKATLTAALETLGDRQVVVCRELTKKFEEIVRSSISEAIERIGSKEQKGEFVLVIEGSRRN